MFAPRIWAIDLGRSAVKGVLLTPVKDGVEILDADIVPLEGPPPDSVKDPSRDNRLWRALAAFQDKHAISRERIAVSIPAQNTLSRDIKVAIVGKRTIDELVRFEASNAIPFVLDEVCWDYHLFEQSGDDSTREGIIFAAKKSAVQTYILALKQIGVERVVDISLAPLAALSFLGYEMGGQGCAMLLDLGAENTGIVAMDGSRFWVRSLLAGGNRISWLLCDKFNVPFPEAEQAKRNIVRSDFAEHFLEALKPGLHELVSELKTNLEYFQRIGKRTDFDRVYAVGGTSRLIGVKAQIRRSLSQELHEIKALEHVFVSADADAHMVQGNLDRLVVAIGTGIHALGRGVEKVSFAPREVAKIARSSRAHWSLLVAGLLFWGIIAAVLFFARAYEKQLKPAADAYDKAAARLAATQEAFARAKDHGAVEQALSHFRSIGRHRDQAPAMLAAVVRVFAEANEDRDYHFALDSFKCTQAKSDYRIEINGRVNHPIDPSQAYTGLKAKVLTGIWRSPELQRTTGSATFNNNSPKVIGYKTRWKGLVAANDAIMAIDDGIWYTVREVLSDTELALTQPFSGGNMGSAFVVARAAVLDLRDRDLSFPLVAYVPIGGPRPSPTAPPGARAE